VAQHRDELLAKLRRLALAPHRLFGRSLGAEQVVLVATALDRSKDSDPDEQRATLIVAPLDGVDQNRELLTVGASRSPNARQKFLR
jgi:hypothetical protein